jgi:hypothetical protein
MKVGGYISGMGNLISDTSRSIQIYRGSVELSTGDEYEAGESLTVKISSTSGGVEYVYEAQGGAQFSGSNAGCENVRVANTHAVSMSMPSSGAVYVWAAWAAGTTDISVSNYFHLASPSTSGSHEHDDGMVMDDGMTMYDDDGMSMSHDSGMDMSSSSTMVMGGTGGLYNWLFFGEWKIWDRNAYVWSLFFVFSLAVIGELIKSFHGHFDYHAVRAQLLYLQHTFILIKQNSANFL